MTFNYLLQLWTCVTDVDVCLSWEFRGQHTRSGRSGYGHFFPLCSEKYLQILRVQCTLRTCSTAAYGHPQFQAFPTSDVNTCFDSGQSVVSTYTISSIRTSLHPFFSGFFHSKTAQNAPEFTSEHLKSMGKHVPRPHGLTTEKQFHPRGEVPLSLIIACQCHM